MQIGIVLAAAIALSPIAFGAGVADAGSVRLRSTDGSTAALNAATATARAASRSLPVSSLPAAAGTEARAPYGWVEFCRRMSAECSFSTAEPETVALTPQLWQAVQDINARINRDIQPMTDMAHWGVVEQWDIPTDGIGDCEDYALLKRKTLADMGIPRRAMRMTVVLDEDGDGHAVLMLRSDRGDFILDNKRDAILAWIATPYTYVKRERQDGIGWASLGNVAPSVATASR